MPSRPHTAKTRTNRALTLEENSVNVLERPDTYFDVSELLDVQNTQVFSEFVVNNAACFMNDIQQYSDFLEKAVTRVDATNFGTAYQIKFDYID